MQSEQKELLLILDELLQEPASFFEFIAGCSRESLNIPVEAYPYIAAKLSPVSLIDCIKDRNILEQAEQDLLFLNCRYIQSLKCPCGNLVHFEPKWRTSLFKISFGCFYSHFTHPVFLTWFLAHHPVHEKMQIIKPLYEIISSSESLLETEQRLIALSSIERTKESPFLFWLRMGENYASTMH